MLPKILYRVAHPLTWHMRWKPDAFDAETGESPGVRWRGEWQIAARWQDFKDSWRDETALICATGPSLDSLSGFARARERGIRLVGVNGAVQLCEREPVRFDLFVATDSAFANRHWPLLVEAFSNSELVAVSPKVACEICRRYPRLLEPGRFLLIDQVHERYGARRYSRRELHRRARRGELLMGEGKFHVTGFSRDPVWGVFSGGTVAIVALQVLAWSGVKRIGLAGLDLSGGTHFYDEREPSISRLERDYAQRILPAMETARRAAEKFGILLINLSSRSRLPATIIPHGEPGEFGLHIRHTAVPGPRLDTRQGRTDIPH